MFHKGLGPSTKSRAPNCKNDIIECCNITFSLAHHPPRNISSWNVWVLLCTIRRSGFGTQTQRCLLICNYPQNKNFWEGFGWPGLVRCLFSRSFKSTCLCCRAQHLNWIIILQKIRGVVKQGSCTCRAKRYVGMCMKRYIYITLWYVHIPYISMNVVHAGTLG